VKDWLPNINCLTRELGEQEDPIRVPGPGVVLEGSGAGAGSGFIIEKFVVFVVPGIGPALYCTNGCVGAGKPGIPGIGCGCGIVTVIPVMGAAGGPALFP
jgi:hypothetical protein